MTQPCMRRPLLQLSNDSNRLDREIQRRRSDCDETEYFGLTFSTLFSSVCYSRVCSKLEVTYKEASLPCQSFITQNSLAKRKKYDTGPSAKSCQTILYLKTEIKPFSRLSAHFVYVFSVTHRCPACVYHRPRGLWPACTPRSLYPLSERPHNGKDH